MPSKLVKILNELEQVLLNELYAGEKDLLQETPVKKKSVRKKTDNPTENLSALEKSIQGCTICKLHGERKNIVFGDGPPQAELMFVGEGPGADEDIQGKPFVGRAGKLLNKIIAAMGFTREEVYIGNVVKCRPPDNRTPESDEIVACSPFLFKQIAIIKPKIICTLGLPATQTILQTNKPMKELRGKFFLVQGIKVLPTYHPAYVLRSPSIARPLVWEDVQKIMEFFGKKPK